MNSLTVNLHLLLARSTGPPAPAGDPHRGQHVPVRQLRRRARPRSTATTRPVVTRLRRARARTRCAPRTSSTSSDRRRRIEYAVVMFGGSTTDRRAHGHPGDHPAGHEAGARGLGPRARRGQRPARAARLGRRLRRVVHVQVPQRGPGAVGGLLRPRAPPRRPPAAVRGLVDDPRVDPVPDGAVFDPPATADAWAGVQPADLRHGPVRSSLEMFDGPASTRCGPRACVDRLPGSLFDEVFPGRPWCRSRRANPPRGAASSPSGSRDGRPRSSRPRCARSTG